VLVTRRWPELLARIAVLGGQAVQVPVIEIQPPDDLAPLEAAARTLAAYDWIVFTSAHAVEALAACVKAAGASLPDSARLAAVGPATAAAVASAWPAAHIAVQPAQDSRGAALLEAFAGEDLAGRRVLMPVSDRALGLVAEGLGNRGAAVDRIVAYRTVAAPSADLRREMAAGLGAAVFASPSAVDAFAAALPESTPGLPAVTVGPTTAETAVRAGMSVLAVAPTADASGVARALVSALARSGTSSPA